MSGDERTSKKMKVLGTETYINVNTGELHEMNVMEVEERDANFMKLWVSSILSAIDELSNQRMKIVFKLVEMAGKNRNVITLTTRELASLINVSRTTLVDTLQILEKNDVLTRKTGVIFMNPEVVYKGSRSGRLEVLTRYRKMKKDTDDPVEESNEDKAAKLMRRMNLLTKELDKIQNEMKSLVGENDQTAADEAAAE